MIAHDVHASFTCNAVFQCQKQVSCWLNTSCCFCWGGKHCGTYLEILNMCFLTYFCGVHQGYLTRGRSWPSGRVLAMHVLSHPVVRDARDASRAGRSVDLVASFPFKYIVGSVHSSPVTTICCMRGVSKSSMAYWWTRMSGFQTAATFLHG